ncbi:hypothetical protein LOK49_Contig307G00001 [Camellia lanceoleosa]|nr:hypothetical protein LOK49_Contig307G00001 [Camellia lanceoleosa]
MENNNQQSFWQFSDQLRHQTNNLANLSLNDSIWSNSYVSKRPQERRNFDVNVGGEFNSVNSSNSLKANESDFNGFNHGWKIGGGSDFNGLGSSSSLGSIGLNGGFNKGIIYSKPSLNFNHHNNNNNNNNVNVVVNTKSNKNGSGLPPRYRDSVRAITPGLPLFLYNYSTHQLHGIFEAASFGGTNIDPKAWEDKKNPGESPFGSGMKVCEPLEEDSFRPILHHYHGPKFRFELNIPEALSLLDIFAENDP